jgi:uncharacterized membrane protein YdjX (TVP38/TMEM64 family)
VLKPIPARALLENAAAGTDTLRLRRLIREGPRGVNAGPTGGTAVCEPEVSPEPDHRKSCRMAGAGRCRDESSADIGGSGVRSPIPEALITFTRTRPRKTPKRAQIRPGGGSWCIRTSPRPMGPRHAHRSQSRSSMSIEFNRAHLSQSAGRPTGLGRLAPLAIILAVMAAVVAMGWHRELTLEMLVRHRATIDALVAAHRGAAILGFMAIYAAAVALSFPGAALLTVAGGLVFGTLAGGCAAIAAATLGATAIFLITKYTLGDMAGSYWARHAGGFGERLAAGFRKDAFCYLVFLRLVPLVPFWLVNLAAAPAGVRLVSFVGATVLGIIPASFAFAFFGAGLNSAISAQESVYRACVAAQRTGCRLDFDLRAAATPELLGGLVALGLIALIPPAVRRLKAMRRARAGTTSCSGSAGLS